MNTKKFKNIILFQVFLTFALAIKAVFFPYSLAPEELTKAIIAYRWSSTFARFIHFCIYVNFYNFIDNFL